MKCPSCGKSPISLKLWLFKYSWARWKCAACNIALKAGRLTWRFIWAGLIYALIVIGLTIYPKLIGLDFSTEENMAVRLSLLSFLLLLIPFAISSYFLCEYRLDEKATPSPSKSS